MNAYCKSLFLTICAWSISSLDLVASNYGGATAAQKFVFSSQGEVADDTNNLASLFQQLDDPDVGLPGLENQMPDIQSQYQAWANYIAQYNDPSVGIVNGTVSAATVNSCQQFSQGLTSASTNIYSPFISSLDGSNTPSSMGLTFMPQLQELVGAANSAGQVVAQIQTLLSQAAQQIDSAKIKPLVDNQIATVKAYNASTLARQACYTNYLKQFSNIDMSNVTDAQLHTICAPKPCATEFQTNLNDYNAMTKANIALFEALSVYQPYDQGQFVTQTYTPAWPIWCSLPELCGPNPSASNCSYNIGAYNFHMNDYLTEFNNNVASINSLVQSNTTQLNSYITRLQNIMNDITALNKNINTTNAMMNALNNSCNTIVQQYVAQEKEDQIYDMLADFAISGLGLMAIGTGLGIVGGPALAALFNSFNELTMVPMVVNVLAGNGIASQKNQIPLVSQLGNEFNQELTGWITTPLNQAINNAVNS